MIYICATLYQSFNVESASMRMKIIGYCVLGAIALALFVVMCAILRDAIVTRDINARSKADAGVRVTETVEPGLRAKP